MRLSKKTVNILQKSISKNFGDVDIYLFGSQVNDAKKGGDIDLALDVELSREMFRKRKIALITDLSKIDFAYDIDLVDFNTTDILLATEIRTNGIKISSL